jgi:hypothetical protein
VVVAAAREAVSQMYGLLLAALSAKAALGQCGPVDQQLAQKLGDTAINDDIFARGIADGTLHATMGPLGRAVGYLPLGSLAMQLTMRMFQSTQGSMVEAFYDQLAALRFGRDGGSPDDLNFDQVDALSSAHRRVVASGVTYERAHVAKAICRAMGPFTRSMIPTRDDKEQVTVGSYFHTTRQTWARMLEVGDTGSEDKIASLIGDLVDLQMTVAAAVAADRAIDGPPTRRTVNFVTPGTAAHTTATTADTLRFRLKAQYRSPEETRVNSTMYYIYHRSSIYMLYAKHIKNIQKNIFFPRPPPPTSSWPNQSAVRSAHQPTNQQ